MKSFTQEVQDLTKVLKLQRWYEKKIFLVLL